MKPTRKLTADQRFFWDHAGYSYGPGESAELGRTRCAVSLAEAEALYLQAHRVADVSCEWEHDADGAQDRGFKKTCESATIWQSGAFVTHLRPLASLHAIWDADDNYRRVVRAELASECAGALRALVAQS